jgi:hypothetical protein
VALITGGVVIASRQQAANRSARSKPKAAPAIEEDEVYEVAEPPSRDQVTPTPVHASRSSKLLEALKEELFELEIDLKRGRISREEYDKAKAALDQTLEHALKRETAKQS